MQKVLNSVIWNTVLHIVNKWINIFAQADNACAPLAYMHNPYVIRTAHIRGIWTGIAVVGRKGRDCSCFITEKVLKLVKSKYMIVYLHTEVETTKEMLTFRDCQGLETAGCLRQTRCASAPESLSVWYTIRVTVLSQQFVKNNLKCDMAIKIHLS